eukprot:749337-Hanusia_phi.AAC.3
MNQGQPSAPNLPRARHRVAFTHAQSSQGCEEGLRLSAQHNNHVSFDATSAKQRPQQLSSPLKDVRKNQQCQPHTDRHVYFRTFHATQ